MQQPSSEARAHLAALDVKQAFGEVMDGLAATDDLLTVVVSDYGRRLSLDHLRQTSPDKFVQVGIAEQNQIEVASALANEGFHVFVPGYAPFVTGRALDQVRVHLGLMGAPAVIVGLSAGYGGGHLGATHMALEDIAIMRTIPGVSVFCPADNVELAQTLAELAASPRPAYVRITCGEAGFLAHPEGPLPAHGDAYVLDGPDAGEPADVTLVTCGTITREVLAAAAILRDRGVSARVVEAQRIKPLDAQTMREVAKASSLLVTVEEHSVLGGLGGAMAEWASSFGLGPDAPSAPVPLLRLGCPDAYPEADYPPALRRRAGLDAESIARSVLDRVASKG
ncbi:MAG: transketolase C-terminal domain-containing protein [Atopobiaceae bacterium]|jgi:transketolase|nr:hypothetical protein [Atopobiaceae bacterium]MCH4181312.1 hypothetical protein [Atopobiaceae bacterium]MCH4215073.1 hypothetical protein [Atopobiaceae bacterium]MCH4230369.1 hypothetical protein [Atopobiaceae bacterium]MCH4276776.1 hypothetical protein [Atopobiaceae bacterium]